MEGLEKRLPEKEDMPISERFLPMFVDEREGSPEHVLEIVMQVTALLLRGLQFPEKAVQRVEEKIRERKVYRMFEDFEKSKVGL